MNFSCGIDFGTTNTSAAIAEQGKEPRLVMVENDSVTIPTALFFDEAGKVYFGREAMQHYMNGDRGRCMRSLKRVLGTDLMSSGTLVNRQVMKFSNILSYFLKHIKQKIDTAVGDNVEDVIMGRPVHFRDNDTKADIRAQQELEMIAKSAGFKNVEFQFEPIAAAFAHEKQIEHERLACVIDIGGGTSDFTIIKIGKNLIHKADRRDDILASSGVRIGGNDFDKDLALECFLPEFGFGGYTTPKTRYDKSIPLPTSIYHSLAVWSKINTLYVPKEKNLARKMFYSAAEPQKVSRLVETLEKEQGHTLLSAVEETKIHLTQNETAKMKLNFLSDKPVIYVDRNSFEESLENDCQKISSSVEECLKQAKLNPEDIQLIILTGGSTEIPYIQQIMCSHFPMAEISQENKLSSVGLGLAYDSARKFMSFNNQVLNDINYGNIATR